MSGRRRLAVGPATAEWVNMSIQQLNLIATMHGPGESLNNSGSTDR